METIKVYGTSWCSDCSRAKQFFNEHDISYDWSDIDDQPQLKQVVRDLNDGNQKVPTIVFPDGSILIEPTNSELKDKLNI
tara:strand:- start:456 stop:695 length:240 start_codon:yes stop_codon:yes gene_type:complete